MSLTISKAQVDAFIQNPTSFSNYSAGSYVKVNGAISHTQASSLNTVNATYIEASVTETSIANIAVIAVDNSTRTSLNKFSFVVSDTSATAAELNSVIAKTSVAPDFTNTDAIEASDAAAIKSLYTATTVGLGNETISVNDTTINAKDLNDIDGYTTGKVTTTATSISGLAADVKKLVLANTAGGGQLAGVAALPITVTDSGAVSAADVKAIVADVNATGKVTISSNATALSGVMADLSTVQGYNTATIAGNTALNLIATDTITPKAQAALAGATTGKVTATITTDPTKTAPGTNVGLFSGDLGDPKAGNLTDLVGTGHALTINVTDTDATAAQLKALDAVTTVKINIDNTLFAKIDGSTAADAIDVLTSSGFTDFADDLVVELTSGTTTVAQANTVDAKTTGKVTATLSEGTFSALNSLTGTGNAYTITISESSVLASDLNALNAKTTTVIDVDTVSEITGSIVDLTKFYTDADKVDGLGAKTDFKNSTDNEILNITDTSIDTKALEKLQKAGGPGTAATSAVKLLNATTLTGTSAEIKAALDGFSGRNPAIVIPADVAVTISEATVSAANLKAIDAKTTGIITVDSTATSLSGNETDIKDVLKNSKLRADANDATGVESVTTVGLSGLDVTITGNLTTVAKADFVADNYTVGKVSANIALATPAKVSTFLDLTASGGVKGANYIKPGNAYNLIVTGDAVVTKIDKTDLANVITLAGITAGTITLDNQSGAAPSEIKGTAAQLRTVYSDTGNGKKYVTAPLKTVVVVDEPSLVQAADLKLIDSVTDKTIKVGTSDAIGKAMTISGTAADIKATVLDAKAAANNTANKIWFGKGSPENPLVVTDIVLDVAKIHALTDAGNNGKYDTSASTGTITVTSPTISGKLTDITTELKEFAKANKFYGLADPDVSAAADDVNTFANIKLAEAETSGVITATMKSDEGIAALKTADISTADTRLRHNLSFDTQVAGIQAADLKYADARTNGTIDATSVTSITGKAAEVLEVMNSTGISNLGTAETLILTDNPSITTLNSILAKTTAPVTGTVIASMSDLNALTETGNNLNISVTGTYTTAELTALNAKTIGPVTVSGTSTITGTLSEVEAVIAAGGITDIAKMNVTVTGGGITVAKLNTLLGTISSGTITATITDTDTTALDDISRKGNYQITIASTSAAGTTPFVESVDATKVTDIAALTNNVLTVTSSTITGLENKVKAALLLNTPAAGTPVTATGLSTIKAEIAGTPTPTQLKDILALTSGVVKSTPDAAALSAYIDADGKSLIGTGNELTLDVNNTTEMSAADLKTLYAATTAKVTLSGGGNKGIKGSIADLKEIFAASNLTTPEIDGVANAKLFIDEGVYSATAGVTSGGTILASDLKALDTATTGTIKISDYVIEVTGTFADIEAVVKADGAGIVTDELLGRATVDAGKPEEVPSIQLTVTDPITVAQANYLLGGNTGIVKATISDGDTATLITTKTKNFAGTDNKVIGLAKNADNNTIEATNLFDITLTDTSVTDGDLKDIASRTAGTVTVNSTTTLKGDFNAPSDLNALFADTTISGISSINVTSDTAGGTNTVDEVNNISGKTSGVVTATISNTTITDLKGLTDSGNALTITVKSASVDAADLNVLNSKTTVAVDVESSTITGALSDIKAAYDANVAGTITGLGNEVVTITDVGSISASELNDLNVLTTGVVTATGVTEVQGSAADLLKAYSASNAAGVVAGLGDENLVITDLSSVSASDITALDLATKGNITASSSTFDAMSYLASNADLITAFGAQTTSAITHYIAHGIGESRKTDSFDEKSYLASHADLLTAFGSDTTKATAHYVSNGFSENRAVDTFDELGYVASYKDLITALGADATAAVDHYINFGFGESRTASFDASSYLAANADLSAAFGSDLELAKKHYINHGVNENRALA